MKSRFLVGLTLLAAVGATIGGTAAAQRFERIRELMQQPRAPADPNPTAITAPGDYRFSFVHGGVTREYLMHVPKSYRGKPTPMLVALHGGGGDADFQADDSKYKLISKSEAAGFIAVFPNGFSPFPSGVLATWNAGTCCGGAQKNDVDDVGFIREVIRRAERQASIDPNRIFATGMSNGAMMTWRLACEAPEVRAIAPVEGTDNTAHCTPSRPVPVIQFHAADDPNVPFNGGVGVGPSHVDFTSVPATQAKWVELNRASAKLKRADRQRRALRPASREGGWRAGGTVSDRYRRSQLARRRDSARTQAAVGGSQRQRPDVELLFVALTLPARNRQARMRHA